MYGDRSTFEILEKSNKPKKLESLKKHYEKFIELKDENISFEKLCEKYENEAIKELQEIVKGHNMRYFFIDDVKGYGSCIVNLLEASHIPIDLAIELQKGVELSITHSSNLLTGDSEDIATYIGTLDSPYIELLLQRFSTNYSRIGIANPSMELVGNLIKGIK